MALDLSFLYTHYILSFSNTYIVLKKTHTNIGMISIFSFDVFHLLKLIFIRDKSDITIYYIYYLYLCNYFILFTQNIYYNFIYIKKIDF